MLVVPVVNFEIMDIWMNETRRLLSQEITDPNSISSLIPQMTAAMERWLLQCYHPHILFLALQLLERIVQVSSSLQSIETTNTIETYNTTTSHPPRPILSGHLIPLLLQRYQELMFLQQQPRTDDNNVPLFPDLPSSLELAPKDILPFSPVTLQMIYDASNEDSLYDACHLMDFLLRHTIELSAKESSNDSQLPTTEHCNIVLKAWSQLNDVVESTQRAGDLLLLMLDSPRRMHPNLQSHMAMVDAYHKEGRYRPGFVQGHLDHIFEHGENNDFLHYPLFWNHVMTSCCHSGNVGGAIDTLTRLQTMFRHSRGGSPMNPKWLESVLQLALQQKPGISKLNSNKKPVATAQLCWQLVTAQVDCAMGARRPQIAPTAATWDAMLQWSKRYASTKNVVTRERLEGPETTMQLWLTLWNKGMAPRPMMEHFNLVMKQLARNALFDSAAATKANDLFQFLLELSETNADVTPDDNTWTALVRAWAHRAKSKDALLEKMDELMERFETWEKQQIQRNRACASPSALYSVFIGIWARTRDPRGLERAHDLFQRMVQRYYTEGDEDILLGSELLPNYLLALTLGCKIEAAEVTLREWMEQGLPLEENSLTRMVKAWTGSGTPERARTLLLDLLQQYEASDDTILESNKRRYVDLITTALAKMDHTARHDKEPEARVAKFPALDAAEPTDHASEQPQLTELVIDSELDRMHQHLKSDDLDSKSQRFFPCYLSAQALSECHDERLLHVDDGAHESKIFRSEHPSEQVFDPAQLRNGRLHHRNIDKQEPEIQFSNPPQSRKQTQAHIQMPFHRNDDHESDKPQARRVGHDSRMIAATTLNAGAQGFDTVRAESKLKSVLSNYLRTRVKLPKRINFTKLLVAWANCPADQRIDPIKAENLLKQMIKISRNMGIDCWPNKIAYTSVIQCWVNSDQGALAFERAMALYTEMLQFHRVGLANLQPDARVCIALLYCLENSGLEDQAQRALVLHKEMTSRDGVKRDKKMYTALSLCILKSNATGKAQMIRNVLSEMVQSPRSLVDNDGVWRILRCCLSAECGNPSQRKEAFEVACEVFDFCQKIESIKVKWRTVDLFFQACMLIKDDEERVKEAAQVALAFCEKKGWTENAEKAYKQVTGCSSVQN